MIELRKISFGYMNQNNRRIRDINLSIREGEFIVIAGLSGCGKTTITRILNGLCPQFYGGELEGEYIVDHKNGKELSISQLSMYWGSVFQDPRSQFFCKRVKDELLLGMENHGFSRTYMLKRIAEVSAILEIEHLLNKDMAYLSSGEKQKLAIASVLASDPKGFILDEPSANLDLKTSMNLALFLRRIKAQGKTVVIAEHRMHYLKDLIDRLIIMQDGRICKEVCKEDLKKITDQELSFYGIRSFDLPFIDTNSNCTAAGQLLSCNGIRYVVNHLAIVKDIELGFEPGKVHVILGENGAGKSSLCRIITGLYKESQGHVRLGQKRLNRKMRYKHTFFVQQDVDYQLYGSSIEDEFNIGMKKKYSSQEIQKALYEVGLRKDLTINPQTLSTGEKQRLLMAISSLSKSAIVVFDEPTSGLDRYHMNLMAKRLKQLALYGKIVIVVTHDMEFVARVADSICYISKGEIKYHKRVRTAKGRHEVVKVQLPNPPTSPAAPRV